MANQSQAEQFDQLYGRLWRVLLKADTEDLSQHDRTRHRDPQDERQLSIVLTDAGVARVRQDSVLDLVRLAAALKKVSAEDRRALLTGLERLAAAADG